MGSGSSPSRTDKLVVAIILLAAVGAFAFRLPRLDLRPMHGDEANQAVKTGILLEDGVYRYDPDEHHGPTLYYLALLSARSSGISEFKDTTESTYRIVPVAFGVALVVLLILVRNGLGPGAAAAAAILTAVSPAFVYYSRYFIQEMLLVCFTFGAISCSWRYLVRPSYGWAAAAGAFLGLMFASKETSIIAFGAAAAALTLTSIWRLGESAQEVPDSRRRDFPVASRYHLIPLVSTFLVVVVLFFTSFFTHPAGLMDSLVAFVAYLERGSGGTIHDKPWYYYLKLLAYTHRDVGPVWTEAFVLVMAAVGAVFVLSRCVSGNPGLLRFLLLYTVLMTAAYSLIPYKTPWTLLSFYHGWILLAGVGASSLMEALLTPRSGKVSRFGGAPRLAVAAITALILILATTHLGITAWRANFKYPADTRNPYVYAHTSTALLRLAERAEDLAKIHPDGHSMLIRVIQPDRDYWPLPWYLRRFDRVGYYEAPPENPDAPMIVAAPALQPELDRLLKDDYVAESASLRPAVLRVVYIEQSLWDVFVESRR